MTSAIDMLTAEYVAWLDANSLDHMSADELICERTLTNAQRAYVGAFIGRWEEAEATDPAFYDKQTVVRAI